MFRSSTCLILIYVAGERRDHADQQSRRQLVRRLGQRQDRLLPHQLRASHRALTQHVITSLHCNHQSIHSFPTVVTQLILLPVKPVYLDTRRGISSRRTLTIPSRSNLCKGCVTLTRSLWCHVTQYYVVESIIVSKAQWQAVYTPLYYAE